MKDYRINKKENKGYIITANCVSRKFGDKEENVLELIKDLKSKKITDIINY